MRPGVALAGVQSLSATLDYPASHYILGTSASESDERPVARKLESHLPRGRESLAHVFSSGSALSLAHASLSRSVLSLAHVGLLRSVLSLRMETVRAPHFV